MAPRTGRMAPGDYSKADVLSLLEEYTDFFSTELGLPKQSTFPVLDQFVDERVDVTDPYFTDGIPEDDELMSEGDGMVEDDDEEMVDFIPPPFPPVLIPSHNRANNENTSLARIQGQGMNPVGNYLPWEIFHNADLLQGARLLNIQRRAVNVPNSRPVQNPSPPGIPHAPGVLPSQIGKVQDYDPHWVERQNANREEVEKFDSRMKFDTLFHAFVIIQDDTLVFDVETVMHKVAKRAHLTVVGFSKNNKQKRFPDFLVEICDPHTEDVESRLPVLRGCSGTKRIVTHLQDHGINPIHYQTSFWRSIMVYRHWETAHPDCLGSLWWVKQAFHTWREKKDIEAGEKGEYFRARRANRKALPKTIKHHNGKIGEWRGEVFVPLPNQEQYLPKG